MDIHQILKDARKNRYAIGSFNFCNAEILRAIVSAAQNLNSPRLASTSERESRRAIIVSTSEGEAGFIGMRQARALVDAWKKETGLPIFLNLDHGKSLDKIKQAIEADYDMVHFDGSELDYEDNIKQTKEVVEYVKEQETGNRKQEILVEGELGYLRGTSALHEEILEIKEEDLTSPEQALDFIKRTGIDSLAMAIGNAHGVFAKSPEKLFLDRLARIKERVGEEVFLVLHGGSGIPTEDIKKAIELGIVKININTEMRLAYHSAIKKIMSDEPTQTTPYKFLSPAAEAVQKVVEEKIKLFFCHCEEQPFCHCEERMK